MKKPVLFFGFICILIGAYFAAPYGVGIYKRIIVSSPQTTEMPPAIVPDLQASLAAAGVALGQPAFLRVFKEERALEVWMQAGDAFVLVKTYAICNHSGDLGPKLKEGDRQSPEGFYKVDRAAMNPNSSYHLSFNLGFPNRYDRAHARTGSYLMIHGDCVSIGCYAMTDAGIEEIYAVVAAAHKGGQRDVPVHAFPFRMTSERMEQARDHAWFGFWNNLKTGYDIFEESRIPPVVSVERREYRFSAIDGKT